MIEVPLPMNWNFSTQEFTFWAECCLNGKWDFKTTASLFNPTMLFEYEEDAVAFKLKFL